jgi:hypothetical protein
MAFDIWSRLSASSRTEPRHIAPRIEDIAPDVHADTTESPISFHAWPGGSWGLLLNEAVVQVWKEAPQPSLAKGAVR